VTALLALEAVTFSYEGHDVLRGVSLSVRKGEILALLGPSGAGKSSIVRLALGLAAPTGGKISVNGQLASEPGRVLLAPEDRGLAVVFQDLALWPHLTVEGNLAFALSAHPPAERRARIEAMLSRVGLTKKARRYPGELSGGERQRVAIARALVASPSLVLLDEPLSNLDVALKQELLHLFRELLTERQMAALYITHDPREAARLAERVIILEDGVIVQEGSLSGICARPATAFIERLAGELGSL
jgi:iron(III) transport system ATP-binding protein